MTNEEAIENLKDEEIPKIGKDGFSNENLINAHLIAISALEENTKLKAEIEEYKKSLLRITQELEDMLSQIMEKACSNCYLKVGLCSECYGYEMCLKALKGNEND